MGPLAQFVMVGMSEESELRPATTSMVENLPVRQCRRTGAGPTPVGAKWAGRSLSVTQTSC